MLHIGINEKLKVDKNESPRTLKDRIEDALPILEEAIIKRFGNDPQLRNFDLGLTVKEKVKRSGEVTFDISSKNLVELTGPIGNLLYKEFVFETWGGTEVNSPSGKRIWFSPKFQFEYKNGGTNGTGAFWLAFWYNIDTDEWIFANEIG